MIAENIRCRRVRLALPTGVSLVVLTLLAACDKGNTYKPPPPPPVTVSQPVQGEVTEYVEFTGNTQAFKTVQLRARVEGYLEKILFKEGDVVNEGQLLFQIQQNTYQAQLKKAKAQLLSAKAQLMHAETEYVRFSGLLQQNAAAQTDVDRWHYERDSNRAAVMEAEAQVELAELNLSYTSVRAPFRGRVSRRYKDPGNLVGAGEETVLADINQIDPIYAYFTVSEQDLLRIRNKRAGGRAEIEHLPPVDIELGLVNEEAYPHRGQLDYRGIEVDATTGTLQLRAVFANPNYTLLPGLFARLRAPASSSDPRWLLPEEAIGFDQGGAYVLTVDDHDMVERRGVTLGTKSGGRVAVTSGLRGTERVIVNGQSRAVPGRPVTVVKAPGAASAGALPPDAHKAPR